MVRVSGRAKEMKRVCWLIVAALLTACSPAPEFSNGQGQQLYLTPISAPPDSRFKQVASKAAARVGR